MSFTHSVYFKKCPKPNGIQLKRPAQIQSYLNQNIQVWQTLKKSISNNRDNLALPLQKNTNVHPKEFNAHFDVMDKNQTFEGLTKEHTHAENQFDFVQPFSPQIQKLTFNAREHSSNNSQKTQIILIVEDDPFQHTLISNYAESLQINFESCMNGQEAVDMVTKYLNEGK